MLKRLAVLSFATLLATAALADEADIQRTFEKTFSVKIKGVTKAGYLGLYEVQTGDGQILYTDEKVSVVLDGQLIDTKTRTNVTEERLRKLNAIKFSDLPLDNAIKMVRGNGKRVMATFEDPNCGYCKKLARDLQKLDNVTIYTFLLPILSEDSGRKSRQIWCSGDRVRTWTDWMVEGKTPAGREDCDTAAITKNQELGGRLRITGTPTLFFADGERVPGAVPLASIEKKLNGGK